MFHLLRNFGSSLFISIAVAEIVRTQSANYARMVEHVSPYNRVLDMPASMGAWSVETASGLAKLSSEIARQSILIGYMNAWLLYTIAAAAGDTVGPALQGPEKLASGRADPTSPASLPFRSFRDRLAQVVELLAARRAQLLQDGEVLVGLRHVVVITYSSPRYSRAPLWLGSKSSALP